MEDTTLYVSAMSHNVVQVGVMVFDLLWRIVTGNLELKTQSSYPSTHPPFPQKVQEHFKITAQVVYYRST